MKTILSTFLLLTFCFNLLAEPEEKREKERRDDQVEKALQGDAVAMYDLSEYYLFRREPELAKKWLSRSAKKNHIPALWKLAHLSAKGFDGETDEKVALECYEQLVVLGELKSFRRIGDLYAQRESNVYNISKAVLSYKDGAENGDSLAMLHLGKLFLSHKDLTPDYVQSFRWFYKAAKLDNIEAMRFIGLSYRYGLGTDTDLSKTWYWYGRAAGLGDRESMFVIAEALYAGKDIEKDHVRAKLYYEKAAANGYREAKVILKILKFDP